MSENDVAALNQLAFRYAAAVDACDVVALQSVFTPSGRLRSYQPDAIEPFADLVGHTQLAAIPNAMRGMYRQTAHMMTNHLVDIDGDRARGDVLRMARHLSADPADPVSINVVIRYVDCYVRTQDKWLIADRQIRFLWSERHSVAGSGMGLGNSRSQG
jgi:hypothetical protein